MYWEVEHLDVTSAYLNSNLKETIFMEQPDGCEVADPTQFVCEIEKSLYGLPQSGRNWNEELNSKLVMIDMIRSECDRCVYFHKSNALIIGVHVDDFLVTPLSLPRCRAFSELFRALIY